jgi:hypothetical protein
VRFIEEAAFKQSVARRSRVDVRVIAATNRIWKKRFARRSARPVLIECAAIAPTASRAGRRHSVVSFYIDSYNSGSAVRGSIEGDERSKPMRPGRGVAQRHQRAMLLADEHADPRGFSVGDVRSPSGQSGRAALRRIDLEQLERSLVVRRWSGPVGTDRAAALLG